METLLSLIPTTKVILSPKSPLSRGHSYYEYTDSWLFDFGDMGYNGTIISVIIN
ncbi:hypothetical protein KCTCHS21_15110 [Cohnella abietis]|uniref:Uncharacterized protein n=1 Tax=Cohnella abietis TaxID=2507935 RepID=A0A3T1D1W8_9BACL|nr:hypothetical protein KCTCHS21_15110 [Cohnella abietis]